MKNVLLMMLCWLTFSSVGAQELNIGLHANPTFTMPIVNGARSVRDKELRVSLFRLGYNVGANLNFKFKHVSLELAANYVRKSTSMYRSLSKLLAADAYYRVSIPSTNIEFPVLANFLLSHHEAETTYDIYLVAGAAYEMSFYDTMSTYSSASTSGNVTLAVEGNYKGPDRQSAISPVLGFKINAVLRRVGLIDYGLTWHLPLTVSGAFNAEARVGGSAAGRVYSSSIFANNSYLDIKICYYFWNIGRGLKKVRYRI